MEGKAFNVSLQTNLPLAFPVPVNSDSPFDQLSPGATDRVFPIRSVVSVDPSPTHYSKCEGGGDGYSGMVASNGPSNILKQREGLRRSSVASTSSDIASDIFAIDISSKPRPAHPAEAFPKEPGTSNDEIATTNVRRGSGQVINDEERNSCSKQMNSASDNATARSESRASTSEAIPLRSGAPSIRSTAEDTGGIITARFKHVVTEGGHAVITGRDGDTLQRCEDEPIHIPGAVQGFGLLIALHEEAE
ncbi:MAG: hypothetical protein Q9187_007347, partial [Circinaria calcarea]